MFTQVRRFLIVGIALFGLYIFWDNNRLTIVEQDIVMDDLPYAFVGFKILQISDLHEKQFGKDQSRLLKAINQIDYDVLVFTGDILDNPESTNHDSFYTLLDGIHHKDHLFYVPGNADTQRYQLFQSFVKSEFNKGIEERGIQILESIYTNNNDEESIKLNNTEQAI